MTVLEVAFPWYVFEWHDSFGMSPVKQIMSFLKFWFSWVNETYFSETLKRIE